MVKDKQYVSLLRTFQDAAAVDSRNRRGHAVLRRAVRRAGLVGRLLRPRYSCFDSDGNLLYPYDGSQPSDPDPASPRRPAAPDRDDRHPAGEARSADLRDRRLEGYWMDAVIGEPSGGLSSSILQYATRIALLTLVGDHLLPGRLLLHRPPRHGAHQGAARRDRGPRACKPRRGGRGRTRAGSQGDRLSCGSRSATCG